MSRSGQVVPLYQAVEKPSATFFTGFFLVISTTYIRIASLAIFVLSPMGK
jgi:hypothetical protein